MSWSIANTGCEGSWTRAAPMDLNLEMTAEVLSWVMMCFGRIVMIDPWRANSEPGLSPTA